MNDHELVVALTGTFGDIQFCGGSETCDLDIALAFVRFVRALSPQRIHPDDVMNADNEADPRWSALALEYVFSDASEEEHAALVIEFFATLPAKQRQRAWSSVQTQITKAENWCTRDPAVIDLLVERSGLPVVPIEQVVPILGSNPPIPFGWQPMPQTSVTPEIAALARQVHDDPIKYPMHASFWPRWPQVLLQVEWVPRLSGAQFTRGVVLYEPAANLYV